MSKGRESLDPPEGTKISVSARTTYSRAASNDGGERGGRRW
jgi:hypothetical protein